MGEQQELIFHDTVPLPLEQLEKGRKKAVRQQDRILAIFREHSTMWMTPYQIQRIYENVFGSILITSIRRSITDMTMRDGTGRLRKGTLADQVMEKWGTNNNRWKYNENYMPSINPQK